MAETGWRAAAEAAELTAYEYIDDLAAEFYSVTQVIKHQGGDLPFDGAVEQLLRRLLELDGSQPPATEAPARRRRVFGVRDSLVVFKRDGYRCVACGTDEDLTVDHVVPWSTGGSDELENLQTLCGACNSRKGARPWA